jgi:hypothetical protein
MKKPKRATRKEKAAVVRKEAERIFLEFYEGSSWAHDKLRSGTASLTPEAVQYMAFELTRRKDAKAREADLEEQNKAIDLAAKVIANGE